MIFQGAEINLKSTPKIIRMLIALELHKVEFLNLIKILISLKTSALTKTMEHFKVELFIVRGVLYKYILLILLQCMQVMELSYMLQMTVTYYFLVLKYLIV